MILITSTNNELILREDIDNIESNSLFQNTYRNDYFFYILYKKNQYFKDQCANLNFIKEYRNNICKTLFNCLMKLKNFQKLYDNTIDISIKKFYETDDLFQVLYLLYSDFREQYHNCQPFKSLIHKDRFFRLFLIKNNNININSNLQSNNKLMELYTNNKNNFRELYKNHERFRELCNNGLFIKQYYEREEVKDLFATKDYNQLLELFDFYELYINNILFQYKFDSLHDPYFSKSYFNKEFKFQCHNSPNFMNEYLDNPCEILFNTLIQIKDFEELYNNTTDESIINFYHKNQYFQYLYLIDLDFREQYNSKEDFQNKIHNNSSFLLVNYCNYCIQNLKQLYFTNKEFQDIYNNYIDILDPYIFECENLLKYNKSKLNQLNVVCTLLIHIFPELKILFNNIDIRDFCYTNRDWQVLYLQSEEFREKYYLNAQYRDKIHNDQKYFKLEYLLYTDSQFMEYYNINQNNVRQIYLYYDYVNQKLDFKEYIFLQYKYSSNIFVNILYDMDQNFKEKFYVNKNFIHEYLDNTHEILFNILIKRKDFKELYNSTKDELIKNFYGKNKYFQILYLKSNIFRNKYNNDEKFQHTIHDNQFIKFIFHIYLIEDFKELYYGNTEFQNLYNYHLNQSIKFHCSPLFFKNKVDYFTHKNIINNSKEFIELYSPYDKFINLCSDPLFIAKCKKDEFHIKFHILYNTILEFKELYDKTTDENVKNFYKNNNDFQLLYFKESFRCKYHSDSEYQIKIHNDNNFLISQKSSHQ